ncbi:MAG: ATP-binding protein, partial [Acidimicrobiales bacterium]
PDLQVLATSRETLGVPGEFLFVVPPLPLDSAVELFLDRMAAGGRAVAAPLVTDGAPGTGTGDGTDEGWLSTVAEICERLDRLPLAVELAAARARHLDLRELAERLDQRFDLLVEGPRTAQPRQRTLRAVVDWSYGLLDQDERRVFERLAVFAGGATLGAARAVCADGDVSDRDVESVVGRLADKSLVALDGSPAGTRVTMLQTLAEYAAERLAEREERVEVERRHAAWANDLTATAELTRAEGGRVERVRALQAESANLQRAILWALANDPLLALRMAANLGWHWFTTMQAGLAWTVLTTALDRADGAPDDVVARVQALAGVAGVFSGRREEAFALADAAYVIEERIGDPARLGWYGFLRATQHVFSVEAKAAGAWLDDAQRWFTEAG